jgi:hypothetical protein
MFIRPILLNHIAQYLLEDQFWLKIIEAIDIFSKIFVKSFTVTTIRSGRLERNNLVFDRIRNGLCPAGNLQL